MVDHMRHRQDVGTEGGDNPHNRFHVGRNDAKRERVADFAKEPLKQFVAELPSTAERNEYTKEELDALTFTRDNNGKIYIRDNVLNYDSGIDQLKDTDPKRYAKLEQEIVKSAVLKAFETFGINKEDLNGLTIKNGVYSFYDRAGTKNEISRDNFQNKEEFDQKRKEFEGQITALGFKVDSISMPDNIKEGVLKYATSTKSDQQNDQAKQALKDGIIHSYRYDKITDQLKFTIVPRDTAAAGDKLDKNMEEVSIDPKSLPSEVRNGLEYHETKQAVIEELRLKVDVPSLRISGNKIHFKLADGKKDYTIDASPSQMKNIKDRLADKGFSINTQQISDSIGNSAIKHASDKQDAISKQVGLDQDKMQEAINKKKALENGLIYDYSYDKKNKIHEYHIVTKEKGPDGAGGTKVEDLGMEKVTFTDEEHKKLLEDATLNAVRKYGKLADGRQITNDMEVDFVLNDKTKFEVKDTDGGKHTLKGDSSSTVEGEDLSTAIKKELDVKPRANPDDILTGKKSDVLIGTKGADNELELLEKELEDYTRTTKRWLAVLKIWGGSNDVFLQAANDVGQVAAQLLHSQDNPSQQQPPGSVLTAATRDSIKKYIKHHREALQKKIDILKEHPNSGKGTVIGNSIAHMQSQLEEIEKAIKDGKNIMDEDKKDMLDPKPGNK